MLIVLDIIRQFFMYGIIIISTSSVDLAVEHRQ